MVDSSQLTDCGSVLAYGIGLVCYFLYGLREGENALFSCYSELLVALGSSTSKNLDLRKKSRSIKKLIPRNQKTGPHSSQCRGCEA